MRGKDEASSGLDPIGFEVLRHGYEAVPEEMGEVLRRSSYSPNIKERLDFSCAIFDKKLRMVAQAEHIPVHLGSMPLAVEAAAEALGDGLGAGDQIVLNDPYHGGTHLPDITIIAPLFWERKLLGFVANRAHHADVGGKFPGSMPAGRVDIHDEGILIPPQKIVEKGIEVQDVFDLFISETRCPLERTADLRAQIAANLRGIQRMEVLLERIGLPEHNRFCQQIISYSERLTRRAISSIPEGIYEAHDKIEDDGSGSGPVDLQVKLKVEKDSLLVDFTGSASQRPTSMNAPYPVTLSCVAYVLRCITDPNIPANHGSLAPVQLIAPKGSIVNPRPPAGVAGGNVETSQRIVDLLLSAFSQALPKRIPAQSQGTMNNIALGGSLTSSDPKGDWFVYYETLAGGAGASRENDGAHGIQCHMTNTEVTPVEALELAFPLYVLEHRLIPGSGGKGKFNGGDGIRRSFQLKAPSATLSLLTGRRAIGPSGKNGGEAGRIGKNILQRDGKEHPLPGNVVIELKRDDIIIIETPGGGGFGKPDRDRSPTP